MDESFDFRERIILNSKNKFYSRIIQSNIPYIVTQHDNEINSSILEIYRRNRNGVLKSLIHTIKNLLSIFTLFRHLRFKQNIKKGLENVIIVYIPNYKVKIELEKVLTSLSDKDNFIYYILIDEKIDFGVSEIHVQTTRPHFSISTFINILGELPLHVGFLFTNIFDRKLVFDVERLNIKLLLLRSYFYSKFREHDLLTIIESNDIIGVINPFAGDIYGALLNRVSLNKNIKVFSYSWGTNEASLEQKYTQQDYLLLKSEKEFERYRYSRFKEVFYIGNISIETKKVSKGKTKYDMIFFDTCYNTSFNKEMKMRFTKEIFNVIGKFNLRIAYKFHPASVDRVELINIVNKLSSNVDFIEKNIRGEELVNQASYVCLIASTVMFEAIVNKVPIISLAKIYNKKAILKLSSSYLEYLPGYLPDTLDELSNILSKPIEIKPKVFEDYLKYHFSEIGIGAIKNFVKIVYNKVKS